MDGEISHADLAAQLRRRVLATGIIDHELRMRALSIDAEAVSEPYGALVRQIAEASYRVTDRHVAAVVEAAGSDKAAFEVIMTASIGAGLHRWDTAVQAIQEASDAAS